MDVEQDEIELMLGASSRPMLPCFAEIGFSSSPPRKYALDKAEIGKIVLYVEHGARGGGAR